jgi:hypothetical protein
MTRRFLVVHIADGDDSLESLARDYRLSSVRAIIEIDANRGLLEKLPRIGNLPDGMRVNIPPNAMQLATERTRTLQQVRPLFLSHFNTLRKIVSENLDAVLRPADTPLESKEVLRLLGELQAFVDKEIRTIASHAADLVEIAEAMSMTHVAEERDRQAARARQDPLCSLYWALTPVVLEQWQQLWAVATWERKWQGQDGPAALLKTERMLNTIETLVIHQLDARLRETYRLNQSLLAEH